jgi:hypothetical protein
MNAKDRHLNYRNRIKRLMREEGIPMTTVQILEGLMSQRQKQRPTRTYKNTPTRQELANILYSYANEFQPCSEGSSQTSIGSKGYAYDVSLWRLVEEDSA